MAYQDPLLAAYHGSEPYIFISYSHRNADRANAVIRSLNRSGYRVWYDEGLIPGREWDENIARIIMRCGYFIALITREYLASSNCRDELNYARDKNKPILLIYLDEVELPAGMELRLGRLFAVHISQYPVTEDFYRKVFSADGLDRCSRRAVPAVSGTVSAARSSSASRSSSGSRSPSGSRSVSASRGASPSSSGRAVQSRRSREAPANPRAEAEPHSSGSIGKFFLILLCIALLGVLVAFFVHEVYISFSAPAPSAPPPPPMDAPESAVPTVSAEAELDIEVTPTPTPETSPAAESTPTPTLTPEVTPTPTPAMTPVVTPELTPVPTPTPTPTPETVQTPEPQIVDPTPTPTPTPTPGTDSVVIVEPDGTSANTVTVVPSS